MIARSFAVVADLLQDTIDHCAKNHVDADGELAWLRKRLEIERRGLQSRTKEVQEAGDKPRETFKQPGATTDAIGGKENAPLMNSPGTRSCEVPSSMSVLQLRRFLRTIGQPTVGIKSALVSRLNQAISSGVVKSFVESFKESKADESTVCAGERRKREAMLALAEAILARNKTVSYVAAPRQPLLESADDDRNSRSSSCSAPGNPGPKLAGEEQDAVLAKIRSAAKRSASPEKKLPFQDNDTPITKGIRLKKEVEDRLERQNQLLSAKTQPDPSSKPTAPPSSTPPLVRTPGQQPDTTTKGQTSPVVSTSPSARPPVPANPAPMPPISPTRSTSSPPPPTSDAPRPAAAPPAPESPAPRATDLAEETPTKPNNKPSSGDYVETSAASRPLPMSNVSKTPVAISKAVAPKGGVDKSADPKPGFCSPARLRTPNTNTSARKANTFAKDSISTTGPSGLKVAAHKAFHRVGAKPSAPSTPAKDVSTPAGHSTTKDAFAKFRAMDSAKKGSAASSFKSRQTPGSKVKPGNNPTMPPPQNKTDYNNFGFSKASASSQAKREVQGAQATASPFRATQHALAKASATANRDKAALAAEKERERARAKAAADKIAADEARREAQAAAEAKAREAAFKAAAERKAKQKAVEAAKRKEEEKQAAVAEALRQAEQKRKAEEKKAAEAEAAANAAAVAASYAMAVARKEEQAALAQKRAQQQKPPTPPRPASKAPPTPPRPSQQSGAPIPPPRPNSINVQNQGHGQSSVVAPSTGESFQLALAKKREEIKERMDVLRQTGVASEAQQHQASHTQQLHASQEQKHYTSSPSKAAPVVKAQSPAPVKSVPKEDRESYDDYEVDEAESGSESGDEGEEQAQEIPEPQEPTDKSGIPDWARGQTLGALLDRQYGGSNPINPDTIFPEFFTCNLEHIFNMKKSKWDRTSSGNWHTDRLTIAEKLAYQRAMGFNN